MNNGLNFDGGTWVVPQLPMQADLIMLSNSGPVLMEAKRNSSSWDKLFSIDLNMGLRTSKPAYTQTNLLSWCLEQNDLLSSLREEELLFFELRWKAERLLSTLVRRLGRLRRTEYPCFSPTTQEVEQIIRNAQNESSLLRFVRLSLTNFLRETGQFFLTTWERRFRYIRRWIPGLVQRLIRIILGSIARFCGVCWNSRIWFLLHGSHPPKTLGFSMPGASRGGALA